LDFVRRMSEGKSWTPTRWNPDEEEPEDYVRLKVRSIWPDLRPKWTETKRNPLLDSLPLVHP
jgi:hypothetical protein